MIFSPLEQFQILPLFTLCTSFLLLFYNLVVFYKYGRYFYKKNPILYLISDHKIFLLFYKGVLSISFFSFFLSTGGSFAFCADFPNPFFDEVLGELQVPEPLQELEEFEAPEDIGVLEHQDLEEGEDLEEGQILEEPVQPEGGEIHIVPDISTDSSDNEEYLDSDMSDAFLDEEEVDENQPPMANPENLVDNVDSSGEDD